MKKFDVKIIEIEIASPIKNLIIGEDYFYSGDLCWIEWPEKIESLLEGESYLRIQIKLSENKRLLEVGMMEK